MPIFRVRTNDQTIKKFEQLHEKLGLKTKGQTFETLVFSEKKEDTPLPHKLKMLETKLNNLMELTGEHL
jgi:hypothetical protein